jgi:hypothetical protein
MVKKNKWIQKVKPKKGVLSKQLGIAEKDKIPMTLLNKIIKAKAGQTISNPTKTGKRRIKVTRLLERRVILAKNLKNISKKKR